MKTYKIGIWMLLAIMSVVFITACEPEYTEPSSFAKPDATKVDFKYTMGATAFDVNFENTSSIDGIITWDLGNGTKVSGTKTATKYRLKGKYTITMTLLTKGGAVEVKKEFEQTETDFSMFTDPYYINLSGGVNMANGKTWVLDSLSKGHIGVGPSNPKGTGLEWWSADPLGKKGVFMYDDEITFNINEFVATLENHGVSYVKGYRTSDAAYSNPVERDGDWNVNFTPMPGNWSIEDKDGMRYLKLNCPKPLFPIFDVGAKDNMYEIVKLTENLLEIVCYSANEDWTLWHYYLIPKGYVKPKVSFDAAFAATANANEFEFSLTNVNIPSNLTISEVKWDFKDKTDAVILTDHTAKTAHTFIKKGTYNVSVTVTDNAGTVYTKELSVVVANNHPSYVPYIEDNMMMYNNFEDVFYKLSVDQAGGVAAYKMMSNPSKVDPNESQYCIEFTKVNVQWANVYMQLSKGYRFDLRTQSKFKMMVYGEAGTKVLLKLENTDLGGNAWQTGVELIYTIQQSNKWEEATYNFSGVANNGSADPKVTDVVADSRTNNGYYNVVRVMVNPGDGGATYKVLLDNLAGPVVQDLK